MKLISIALGASVVFATAYETGSAAIVCNDELIRGEYEVDATGFQDVKGNFLPFAAALNRVFDGKGHFVGAGFQSVGGVAKEVETHGNYRISADCAISVEGMVSTGVSNTQFGVVSNGGNNIDTVRIDPGDAYTVHYRRVVPQ